MIPASGIYMLTCLLFQYLQVKGLVTDKAKVSDSVQNQYPILREIHFSTLCAGF